MNRWHQHYLRGDYHNQDPKALYQARLATVQEALDQGVDTALALAGPEDVICAWGSLYSVGEIRHHLGLC